MQSFIDITCAKFDCVDLLGEGSLVTEQPDANDPNRLTVSPLGAC